MKTMPIVDGCQVISGSDRIHISFRFVVRLLDFLKWKSNGLVEWRQ
jgi:hypothetical protein